MLIAPVIQRETGIIVAYSITVAGSMICFGKTRMEAITNGFRTLGLMRVVPVTHISA